MLKFKTFLLAITLATSASLAWAGASNSNPTIAVKAADPATCSVTGGVGENKLYYNTVSANIKVCTGTNTWTLFNALSFDQVTGGTNTNTLLIGTGGSLAPNGSGTITANVGSFLNGTLNAFPIFTGTTGANNLGTSLLTTDLTTLTSSYTGGLNVAGSGSGCITLSGLTSGSAKFCVPAVAGTPNQGNFPTTTGAAGQFLISDGGNPQQFSWSNYFKNNAQTGTYQVLAADFQGCKTIPVASGTFTVTLVASGSQPGDGQCVRILNYGSGVVTVARSGQNINGAAANLTIAAGSASAPNGLWVVSDAANYFAQPLGSGSGSSTPCTVTASSLQYNNAGAFGCVTDFTFSGHTITSAAAGLLDLSAMSGANAFKIPVGAGLTSGADGVVAYDSTGKLTHVRTNAADSSVVAATATSTTTTQVLHATAVAGIGAFSAIAAADLPNPSASTLGGIESLAAVSHQFINTISTSGVPAAAQPAISDISNLYLVDAQTGTSYTIVAADCGKLVTFNNAAATAVTLPQATGSFAAPCSIGVENLGAGVVTITPTTSTIAGLTAIALNQNQGVIIRSDSTNYQVLNFTPSYLPVAAQVDTLQVGGTATGTDPFLQPIGSDTNIGMRFLTKGTGIITLQPGSDSAQFITLKNAAGSVLASYTSSTGSLRLGGSGNPGAVFDIANKYFVSSGGVNTKYNNISTVSNGHPSEYATVDLTAQSAAITATTLYAVPAAANGMYRVCFVAKVTTAATTSSTLGGAAGFQLTYTDQDDSVVVTTLSGAFWDSNATNIALNTTQAHMGGCTVVNAKASTNIQYQMGYTSSGGTAMQYNLHIKLEAE